jgi:hypothetical protein
MITALGRFSVLLLVVAAAPTALAVEPLGTDILTSVSENKRAQVFAGLVRVSELGRGDFGSAYTSFLVPRDSDCTAIEISRLEGLKTKNDARTYVLDHAFKGQLNVMAKSGDVPGLTAYYFPGAGTMDVLGGRVTIDEAHPFSLPLLSGRSVLISISKNVVRLGARSNVLDKNDGAKNGDEFELDECAVF